MAFLSYFRARWSCVQLPTHEWGLSLATLSLLYSQACMAGQKCQGTDASSEQPSANYYCNWHLNTPAPLPSGGATLRHWLPELPSRAQPQLLDNKHSLASFPSVCHFPTPHQCFLGFLPHKLESLAQGLFLREPKRRDLLSLSSPLPSPSLDLSHLHSPQAGSPLSPLQFIPHTCSQSPF